MTADTSTESLLRELAPQVLGVMMRKYHDFAAAEDAVQEALLAATTTWPAAGVPDNPRAWLVTVASRRMTDEFRRNDARHQREVLAASITLVGPEAIASDDDTLILIFMCCHPDLTPASAIPLTLRAVCGLTTREIAAAFFIPEATMAQRISRAKAKVKESDEPFALPSEADRAARRGSVLRVLYLIFNEGYASSGGPDLARTDLSSEAIRLTRSVVSALPDDAEVAGLLALMLLNDARRAARTGPSGELIPLAEQDRSRWDRACIMEGVELVTAALKRGPIGEYQVQAAIAALHDQALSHETTEWDKIVPLYERLEEMTGNPMVTLNRAVAVAMAESPAEGLKIVDSLSDALGDHYRWHSVRAHLLEITGDVDGAVAEFRIAAGRTANQREQYYLTKQAARLTNGRPRRTDR